MNKYLTVIIKSLAPIIAGGVVIGWTTHTLFGTGLAVKAASFLLGGAWGIYCARQVEKHSDNPGHTH